MSELLTKRVKEYRRKSGWSQQRLAEITGLSYGIIQLIETGRTKNPEKNTLVKLADAFGISLDELIGRELPRSNLPRPQRRGKKPS